MWGEKGEVKMKRVREEPRDQVMAYKVTREERRIIEAEAKKQGCSPAAYMRGAVLMTLVLDGNAQALVLAGREIREQVVDRLKSWVEVGVPGAREA